MKTKTKKDKSRNYFSTAIVLFVIQGLALIGRSYKTDSDPFETLGEVLGYFLPATIGLIFLILAFKSKEKPQTINNTMTNKDISPLSLEHKLKQLETLLEKGVLTKEEYDSKRKSIINDHK